MQLRFDTKYAGEDYVAARAWQDATLPCCPMHPQGGCAFARHGTYCRKTPAGTRIARWYCPDSHCTFSLLPDFLPSRLPGTFCALEEVVLQIEQSVSLEAAANTLRQDCVGLPGAIRWTRRRLRLVHHALTKALAALPSRFGDYLPRLSFFRDQLGIAVVLIPLRILLAPYLQSLPPPLGFAPRRRRDWRRSQQHKGPDPPVKSR